jgi:predicted metal-dependent phosphoesterase TrpH
MSVPGLLFWNGVCGFPEVVITEHNLIWDEKRVKNKCIKIFFEMIFAMKIVSGVEVSCRADLSRYLGLEEEDVHIVGFAFHPDTADGRRKMQELQEVLAGLRQSIDRWQEEIIGNIRAGGFEVPDLSELKKKNRNVILKTIAQNVEQGGKAVEAEAFEREYLRKGGAFSARREFLPTVHRILSLIQAAGGTSALPHPLVTFGADGFQWSLRDVLLELKKEGLCQVESRTKLQSKEDTRNIERICREEGLGTSAGADTHDLSDLFLYMKNMLQVCS